MYFVRFKIAPMTHGLLKLHDTRGGDVFLDVMASLHQFGLGF